MLLLVHVIMIMPIIIVKFIMYLPDIFRTNNGVSLQTYCVPGTTEIVAFAKSGGFMKITKE